MKTTTQSILQPLTQSLVLDATDGTQIIADASALFTGWIDSDFRNYGADEASGPTTETPVTVYEMREDATFEQMFNSLGVPKEQLCLTQSQVITFVQKHREHLRTDGYATFFLFQSKGKFFVASVCFSSDGRLGVLVNRFGNGSVWDADYRRRVVVPQL